MILISPWAKRTTEGGPSPKNYPYWGQVVQLLKSNGHKVHQVSCKGEPDVSGCNLRSDNLEISNLELLLHQCETFISVDSMLQHLAWSIGEQGVVIFGLSDPDIFGHSIHINLLKSRRYLREQQFWLWSQVSPKPEAFVPPEQVVAATLLSITRRKR